VVLLGLAGGFTFAAKSKFDASKQDGHCDAADTCDSEGLVRREAAFNRADLATAFAISGGVFLVSGVTLYFLSRQSQTEASLQQGHFLSLTPLVSAHAGGLSVRGKF
jgi:hypothetical protein